MVETTLVTLPMLTSAMWELYQVGLARVVDGTFSPFFILRTYYMGLKLAFSWYFDILLIAK